MKNKMVKRVGKRIALFAVASFLFWGTGADVKAAMSDEVPISTTVPGAACVDTINSSVYVRSGPGTQYSVITSIPSQDNIVIVQRPNEETNGFYEVQYNQGASYGYMTGQYLTELSMTHYFTATPEPGHTLNFRATASLSGTKLADIPYNGAFPGYDLGTPFRFGLYARWEGYAYASMTTYHAY